MPSIQFNDFTVIKALGSGAFSQVYKVQRKQDGQIYALKKVKLRELSDREIDNSLNEIRILASIKSPHIIRYKDAFYDNESGSLCIIMEYAENRDLLAKIQDYKQQGVYMNESKIWKYAAQILLGLKSLHDQKILHRDLKCANIFLGANNKVKLGDLNVSKIAKDDLAYTQIGTPYYTSPEVWQNQPYDSKCDIWSLGCVLYELMAHFPPFQAKSMEGVYKNVCKGTYQKLPKYYSQEMNDFIGLCLRKTPKTRPSVNSLLEFKQLQVYIKQFQEVDQDNENQQPNTPQKKSFNLIQTIKTPQRDLNELRNILPKAQFEDSIDSFIEENIIGFYRPISAINNDLQSNLKRYSLEPIKVPNLSKNIDQGYQQKSLSPPSIPPIASNTQIHSNRLRIQSDHQIVVKNSESNQQPQNQQQPQSNLVNIKANFVLPKSPMNIRIKKFSSLQRNGIELINPRNSIEECIPQSTDKDFGALFQFKIQKINKEQFQFRQ